MMNNQDAAPSTDVKAQIEADDKARADGLAKVSGAQADILTQKQEIQTPPAADPAPQAGPAPQPAVDPIKAELDYSGTVTGDGTTAHVNVSDGRVMVELCDLFGIFTPDPIPLRNALNVCATNAMSGMEISAKVECQASLLGRRPEFHDFVTVGIADKRVAVMLDGETSVSLSPEFVTKLNHLIDRLTGDATGLHFQMAVQLHQQARG